MITWEYQYIENWRFDASMRSGIEAAGKAGWELVTIFSLPGMEKVTAILKRPIEPPLEIGAMMINPDLFGPASNPYRREMLKQLGLPESIDTKPLVDAYWDTAREKIMQRQIEHRLSELRAELQRLTQLDQTNETTQRLTAQDPIAADIQRTRELLDRERERIAADLERLQEQQRKTYGVQTQRLDSNKQP